jgi:hypothetical protein
VEWLHHKGHIYIHTQPTFASNASIHPFTEPTKRHYYLKEVKFN